MSELVCPKDGVQTVLRRSAEGGEEDRLLGRTLGGRFRVEGAVGKGGFATVYVATQLSMGRQVALKALHPDLITDDEQLQRFFREARAASRIASPHVVRIHDFGVDDDTGTPFIAMELIEGITLAKELRGGGTLPQLRAAHILRQAALALLEAHGVGVIHRDLKPENISLAPTRADPDAVKVMDFGIAKVLSDETAYAEQLTATGIVVGTARYMAPEQCLGREVSPATDLYALGCILHEVLTGKQPFAAADPLVTLNQHVTASPPPLPDPLPSGEALHPELGRLHEELLRKDPVQRPRDAEAVARALEAVERGEAVSPSQQETSPARSLGTDAYRPTLASPQPGHVAVEEPGLIATDPAIPSRMGDAETLSLDEADDDDDDDEPLEALAPRLPLAAVAALALVVLAVLVVVVMWPRSRVGGDRPPAGERALVVGELGADAGSASGPSRSPAGNPAEIDWVRLDGGRFRMGSEEGGADERPVHLVRLRDFDLARTETTVDQYRRCVDAGACKEPATGTSCNWGKPFRVGHPVNCLDWYRAKAFCEWAGGRLPTEAEWEHAARGEGRERAYPWGDDEATCARAVMDEGRGAGCGEGGTSAACSRPAGRTEQGLCDMAGNVWEWVADWYDRAYYSKSREKAPPGPDSGIIRVVRGGGYGEAASRLRAAHRFHFDPGNALAHVGCRCARSAAP